MIVDAIRCSRAKKYATKQSKNCVSSLLDDDSFCFASLMCFRPDPRCRANRSPDLAIDVQLFAGVDARYASATQLNSYAKPMKLICSLILFAFVSGHAHAISSEKCLALGGKYLAGECYKGAESELMWSDADVVTLSREQCETAGGKMLNGDCVAEVSEDECRRLGGELAPTQWMCNGAHGRRV